jgi:hypothetical protein
MTYGIFQNRTQFSEEHHTRLNITIATNWIVQIWEEEKTNILWHFFRIGLVRYLSDRTALQVGMSRVWFPKVSLEFFTWCIFTFRTRLVHTYYGARCWWRSWLMHCATCRKVAGTIPDGVTGNFYWHIPSGRTMMALGFTQPLTEMSTKTISWE